jgi:alpha-beta hydrolase superfamily lysophospholipase
MFKISEGRFKGVKNVELYFQAWTVTAPRGTIVITHGHGEHTDSYRRVVDGLKNENWDIYAWDMRGHGRSEGIRGFSESFDLYCDDYKIFLNLVQDLPGVKERPLVYLAHSMGGLVQLKTMILNPDLAPDAMVLSSPLVGIGVRVPPIKKLGAEWLNKLVPTVTMWNEVQNKDLTRDAEVIREFEQDPFRHARISAGVYLGFLESFPFVQDHASEVHCPTLMQGTNKDAIVSTSEALRFFENLGSTDKILKIYDNAKHEIYNDTIREQVLQDLREFLSGVHKAESI